MSSTSEPAETTLTANVRPGTAKPRDELGGVEVLDRGGRNTPAPDSESQAALSTCKRSKSPRY